MSWWRILNERFPGLPAEHFTSKDELLLSLQDQLLSLSVVDGFLETADVFVLKVIR